MGKVNSLSFSGRQLHAFDRDRFFACLFVPRRCRDALMALCALCVELRHVHHAVSEELLAHVRYAWWQEHLDALYAGKPVAHPLLQELNVKPIPQEKLMALVEAYRGAYPDLPEVKTMEDELCEALIEATCPSSLSAWRKAGHIIGSHRARYGMRRDSWLHIKLLLA